MNGCQKWRATLNRARLSRNARDFRNAGHGKKFSTYEQKRNAPEQAVGQGFDVTA